MTSAAQQTIEIPAQGLRFAAQICFDSVNDAGGSARGRRFSGIAYGGGVITDHGWWDAVAFDLAGLTAAASMPLLLHHDSDRSIGVIDVFDNDGACLSIGGRLFTGVEPEADRVAAKADAGMPWQMSVGIFPDLIDEVQAGAVVNGRAVDRRVHVFRKSRVREASFVALGADGSTSATVFAGGKAVHRAPLTHSPKEPPMADDTNAAALAAMTAQRDAETARADQAVAELAALREQFAARERTERQAAVQALFGAEFAAAPDKAAPYLAMTVEQFAAVKVAVEAERASRLPPGFTVEQAKGGPGGALTAAAITECRAKHPGMTWEQAFAALKHSGGASAPATFAG